MESLEQLEMAMRVAAVGLLCGALCSKYKMLGAGAAVLALCCWLYLVRAPGAWQMRCVQEDAAKPVGFPYTYEEYIKKLGGECVRAPVLEPGRLPTDFINRVLTQYPISQDCGALER